MLWSFGWRCELGFEDYGWDMLMAFVVSALRLVGKRLGRTALPGRFVEGRTEYRRSRHLERKRDVRNGVGKCKYDLLVALLHARRPATYNAEERPAAQELRIEGHAVSAVKKEKSTFN